MDVVDMSQPLEQEHLAAALARHKARQSQWKPKPFEVNGERFCVICGDDINPQRVQATDAVYCESCDERMHRRAKHGA